MSEVKFTDEELSKIKLLQDDFNSLVLQFGQLQVEELNLTSASKRISELKSRLSDNYASLVSREKEIADELSKKYGAGILDPRTGVFTPNQK